MSPDNRKNISSMRVVNRPVAKVDARALVTGRAVYTNDIV